MGNITGDLRAHTETGDIFFRHVGGHAEARTDTGDVVVSRCTGSLSVHVLRGMIRVGTVTGRCELQNESGDVELLSPKTDFDVSATAGNAVVGVPKDFRGRGHTRSSAGNIIANIDPQANCDVDASASWLAHVIAKLPLAIAQGRNGARKVAGRLNAGGSRLVLQASGGNVVLQRGESPFEDGSEDDAGNTR